MSPVDYSKYIKKGGVDYSRYIKRDVQPSMTMPDTSYEIPPQPAASTRVDVSRETYQPPMLRDTSRPYISPEIGQKPQQPPSWLDVLARSGKEALGTLTDTQPLITRDPQYQSIVGDPQRDIHAQAIENEAMRERQTTAQNVIADLIGFVPYMIHPGISAGLIGRDIAEDPGMVKTMATEEIPQAWMDIGNVLSELKTGIPDPKAKKALREHPIGVPFTAVLPALIAAGGIKGGQKLRAKIKGKPSAKQVFEDLGIKQEVPEPPKFSADQAIEGLIDRVKTEQPLRGKVKPKEIPYDRQSQEPVLRPVGERPELGQEKRIPGKVGRYEEIAGDRIPEVPEKVKPTPKAVKEPWEMTGSEFVLQHFEKPEIKAALAKPPKRGKAIRDITIDNISKEKWLEHESAVKQALSEDKPVPPEVLKDYPDLAPKSVKKPIISLPKYDLSFIDKIRDGKQGDVVGTVGDFVIGSKTRKALNEALDVPIMVLNRAIEKGKTVTSKHGMEMAGSFGTFKGKPTIFVSSKSADIPATILEEAVHSIRSKRGRSGGGGNFADLTKKLHDALPGEQSAAKFVEYVQNIQEKPTPAIPKMETPKKIVIGGEGKKIREHIKKKKSDSDVELAFMGVSPQAMKNLGESAIKGMKETSKISSEILEKTKVKPEIKAGVKDALEAITEHDRQIRDSEWVSRLLRKTVKDIVKDPDRQMLMTHAYEHQMRGKYWNQLNEIEKGVTKWLAKEKAKVNNFIEENQVLDMMKVPGINHIFHHFINPKTGEPYPAMYSKFSKGLPQAKQRKVPTYDSDMAKNLKPATPNLGELIGLELESATRANQSREMFKTLYNIGAEKGVEIQLRKGKPTRQIQMVERWDLLQKQGLSEGYERYSHPALDKVMVFKDPRSGMNVRLKGAVGVRKELYPQLYAYLESPTYGNLMKLNFATKSLKLGFSLFHVMSLGAQEMANWRLPFKNIPRGLKLIKDMNPEMRILYKEGLDLWKGYEDTGYRNRFFEGVNWAGKAGNIATKPIELMRSFIFDVVQPGMKASFAYDKYNKNLPKYLKKGMTKEQCAREVVKASDGHFSHEHYKRSLLETNRWMVKMYFTPGARKFWQSILLSPTWQREHLLVGKNIIKSFMTDKMIKRLKLEPMGPIKAEYRKYLLGAICMIGAVDLYNCMSTYQMDGKSKHIWQNPEGKGFAVRAPWNEPLYTVIDKNGKEKTIPGGPAFIRPVKSIYEVAESAVDPVKKFTWKLSPVISGIGRQLFPSRYQKEYKGIEDIPKRVLDFILDVGTPIQASQMTDVIRGKKTIMSGTMPFFGMPTSKMKSKDTKELYYKRMIEAVKKKDWKLRDEIKKEFTGLGYKYSDREYNSYINRTSP